MAVLHADAEEDAQEILGEVQQTADCAETYLPMLDPVMWLTRRSGSPRAGVAFSLEGWTCKFLVQVLHIELTTGCGCFLPGPFVCAARS